MRITILHSSVSANASLDDQETLEQVAAVRHGLTEKGHQVSELAFSLDFSTLTSKLRMQEPDVVFNLVEAIDGSTELVHFAPLLLEQLQIPFTGANATNVHLSTNKLLAKNWLRAGKLPTPAWVTLKEHADFDCFPAIVKSVTEHGSLGIAQDGIANNTEGLGRILTERKSRYGGEWFAEQFIAGREFNIAIVATSNECKILPVAEMQFIHTQKQSYNIIDYAMKWECDHPSYNNVTRHFIASSDPKLNAYLTDLAHQCCRWFNLTGYARIDVRLDAQQQAWILEVNVNPSLAEGAGFSEQAAEMGWDHATVIDEIVNIALKA